jgi:hypothetical protein
VPQPMFGATATGCPSRTPLTARPARCTTPASSWPRTSGLSGPTPLAPLRYMRMSVPQTAAARTASSTSPGPTSGVGTSWTRRSSLP